MGIGSLHTVLMFSSSWGWGACVWFLFKSGGVLSPLNGGIAAGERDQFREGALSASCLALAPTPGGGSESIESLADRYRLQTYRFLMPGLLTWRFNRSNAICTIMLVLAQKNREM